MATELIPIAAMAVPVAIVGIVTITKHLARNRELAHLERMESLRMGVPIDSGGHAWKALACAAIGAGVPIASFVAAWMASLTAPRAREEIWFATVVVSLAAVTVGGWLARKLLGAPARSQPISPAYHHDAYHAGKPQGDPDLYDVAGRRG